MRRRSARPEDAIQRAVFQHLRQRGAPGVFYWHTPNGGKRKPIEAAILKGLGVRAGVPDVIAIHGGRIYALELKAPGGKLSSAQIETLELMEHAGAIVDMAEGLDAALRWLEEHRLLRGAAA